MGKNKEILVDCENLTINLSGCNINEDCTMHLFMGINQNSIRTSILEDISNRNAKLKILQNKCEGKHSLDLVLAMHLGQVIKSNEVNRKEAEYFIISRDKGFDSLCKNLRSEGYRISRHENMENFKDNKKVRTEQRNEQRRENQMQLVRV